MTEIKQKSVAIDKIRYSYIGSDSGLTPADAESIARHNAHLYAEGINDGLEAQGVEWESLKVTSMTRIKRVFDFLFASSEKIIGYNATTEGSFVITRHMWV